MEVLKNWIVSWSDKVVGVSGFLIIFCGRINITGQPVKMCGNFRERM